MQGWEDIEDSIWSGPILRYKNNLHALSVLVHTLEGLQATLAMHNDLKSRCLIPLLKNFLEHVPAMRQELRPLADFYMQDDEHRVYVNRIEFMHWRRAGARLMTALRRAFRAMHEHLEIWHVQEFGNFSLLDRHPSGRVDDWSDTYVFLENTIWDDYMQAYTTLVLNRH